MRKRLLLIVMASSLLLSGCGRILPNAKTAPIEQDSHFMYARTHLDKKEKKDYDQIFNTLMDHKEKASIHAASEAEIIKIFDSVLADHPEIFWTSEFRYQRDKEKKSNMIFYPVYAFDQSEIKDFNRQLKSISKQIIQGIDKNADDYEKVKYIYDFIINQTEYVDDAPNSQNIISSLINKTSVCAGYAKAVQYLLAMLDIDCAFITGKATENNVSHAWNMVKMDDEYYYLDATYADSDNGQNVSDYRYIYFGMTSDEIAKLYNEMAPHEISNATADTYYMKNNCYFTSYDEEQVKQLVKDSVRTGNRSLLMKFDTAETMQSVHQQLTDQYRLFSILETNGIALKNINFYMIPELHAILYFY